MKLKTSGASKYTVPGFPRGKGRKFRGAARMGYGPAMSLGATLGMGGGGDTVTTSSGADVGMGVAGGDGMGDAVDGGIGVFEAFLESMRDPDTSETIDVILQGYQVFCESVVDAKVKPGKMHRILDIDPSESIESDPRYSTPRKLASALKEKVGYAKAMKMLTFAANIKSGDQFMDKAKSALEKMGE